MTKINLHEMFEARMLEVAAQATTSPRDKFDIAKIAYIAALSDLQGKVDGLFKALEFYADADNYGEVYEDDEMDLGRMLGREDVSFDEHKKDFGYAGKLAREALAEFKNGEGEK